MTKVVATPVAESSAKVNPSEGNTKKVIPENSRQAQKLLAKAEKNVTKPEAKTEKAPKKAKKERAESNEHIGERLYAEKASKETVLATFMKIYKEKKGITDKKFVQARAEIYLAIAAKKAGEKKEAKKAKAA